MSLVYTISQDGKSKEVSVEQAEEFMLFGGDVQVTGPLSTIYKELGKVFPHNEYRPGVAAPIGGGKAILYLSKRPLQETIITYQPREEKESVIVK